MHGNIKIVYDRETKTKKIYKQDPKTAMYVLEKEEPL